MQNSNVTVVYQLEEQGESLQDSSKTGNDVRGRGVGSEESAREVNLCGGNEDVDMDDKVGQNKERKIRGTM